MAKPTNIGGVLYFVSNHARERFFRRKKAELNGRTPSDAEIVRMCHADPRAVLAADHGRYVLVTYLKGTPPKTYPALQCLPPIE